MNNKQSLKELLVTTSNDLEHVASGKPLKELPTEDELESKIEYLAKEIGWSMEEAYDYVDFINNRY